MSPEPNTCQEGYHWVEGYFRGIKEVINVSGYLHGDCGDFYSTVGRVYIPGHWAKNPVRKAQGVKA